MKIRHAGVAELVYAAAKEAADGNLKAGPIGETSPNQPVQVPIIAGSNPAPTHQITEKVAS